MVPLQQHHVRSANLAPVTRSVFGLSIAAALKRRLLSHTTSLVTDLCNGLSGQDVRSVARENTPHEENVEADGEGHHESAIQSALHHKLLLAPASEKPAQPT